MFIHLNTKTMSFKDDAGRPVEGTSLKFIQGSTVDNEPVFSMGKEWFKPDQTELIAKARKLKPGQLFDIDYAIAGNRKVIVTDIIPGELAVDFDIILNKKGD